MIRSEKTYKGDLMKAGSKNEKIILEWLIKRTGVRRIVDYRDHSEFSLLDIDYGIENNDRKITLLEIKSDRHVYDKGNLCFEHSRFEHNEKRDFFYLGWGYRSKADALIVRNPKTNDAYYFKMPELRTKVSQVMRGAPHKINFKTYPTDKERTTLFMLVPMTELSYTKFSIPETTK